MLPAAARSQAELHSQRKKLTTSYNALLEEFSSKDLRAVGNYNLGSLIGKGSFGKVYLGTHKLTNGSKVVLKSAKKEDANLAREIHHHRQFLHPHIARLYEVIVTESLVWLVLEYCPGDELYHYLTHHGPIEPERVQKIFTQLVGAVSYVHSKSCVHRDLKLENILLDKHGNVKLCDFGFTREYEGKSSYLQTWCGTVCYSAPEMLKGEKYAGEKVDVWSLGVILYALLCGELPFDEDDETVTKARILKEEPKYPEAMPAPAKELVQLLLSKRPLLRPSLADVLNHPWLMEHAPQQQEILKVEVLPPFVTQVEKDTLQRMRNAGVDIDVVIENVLSQRCDSLAGWWAILLEKEQRKEIRRQRKRQEREADGKASRRVSTASAHLGRIPLILRGIDEEGSTKAGAAQPVSDHVQDTKGLNGKVDSPLLVPTRSAPLTEVVSEPSPAVSAARIANGNANAAKRRSQMNGAIITKRNSTLTLLATNPDFHGLNAYPPIQKRKKPFLMQLATIKSWFKDSSKRVQEPASTSARPTVNLSHTDGQLQHNVPQAEPVPNTYSKPLMTHVNLLTSTTVHAGPGDDADARQPDPPISSTPFTRPPLSTRTSTASSINTFHRGRHRNTSHSPAPRLRREPQLGSRKSTSSSVSSVRSLSLHRASQSFSHQQQQQPNSTPKHTHSKASSTSSTNSTTTYLSPPAPSTPNPRPRSPNHRPRPLSTSTGLKILPPPPASPAFPSSIRVVRTPPASIALDPDSTAAFANYLSVAHGAAAFGPVSPGLPVFARGRKKVFKGPSFGGAGAGAALAAAAGSGAVAERRRGRRSSAEGPGGGGAGGGVSRNGSNAGKNGGGGGGGLMNVAEDEEEDEGGGEDGELEMDMDMEMEVEEVDAFSPVLAEHGVEVEIMDEGQWSRRYRR